MSIGLFGGTFDPVHNGHLKIASEMLRLLNLTELRFVPCAFPSHRNTPVVSPEERAAMIELAIEIEPRFVCDRREISRMTTSYTIDTLAEVREELGVHSTIVFLMGCDALMAINKWKSWSSLLNFAHLVIVDRPGWSREFPSDVGEWIKINRASAVIELQRSPHGLIYLTSSDALDISSTEVRRILGCGGAAQDILPVSVRKFAVENKLYLDWKISDDCKTKIIQDLEI